MIFEQNPRDLRQMYVDAWRKHEARQAATPLEQQIAAVIAEHPEYHRLMSADIVDADFSPESGQTNPFLHMGLHLAIREQVSTDRPLGISLIFNKLLALHKSSHDAEHTAMECLAETLWEAQGQNTMPDEAKYLERLKHLSRTSG